MARLGRGVRIAIEATAEAELDIEGLYYRIDIPRQEFSRDGHPVECQAIPCLGQASGAPLRRGPGRRRGVHFRFRRSSGTASWDKPTRVLF